MGLVHKPPERLKNKETQKQKIKKVYLRGKKREE